MFIKCHIFKNVGDQDTIWGLIRSNSFFFFFSIVFVYVVLPVLGLPCCVGFSLVVARRRYFLLAVHGGLILEISLVAEHGF